MDYERLNRAWKRLAAAPVLSWVNPVVSTRFGDRRVYVDVRDRIIGRPYFVHGRYETELQALMRHMNLRDGVCVDVGANIGLHTLEMSRLVGAHGRVIAFEPESHNFDILRRNLLANGCDNVRPLKCAVSDARGTARVELSETNFGDHRVVAGTPGGDAGSSPPVEVTTLDDALSDIPDNAVRFIKIDVQGHEMKVLHGMTETIRRNPDAIFMVEVSPSILPKYGSSASELVSALYELGLTGWELQDRRVFPALPAWTYDLIRDEQWTDLILSRNERLLTNVISTFCARDLPRLDGR
jgi:FkbM family methyltransferase